ncbi:hypothetical protein ACFVU3_08025 [Streptomyces sp. NPDC058052]|uniref:hypothetical protein n=1 Tax=Streptomyces sp. NPDC058052 TaxID=3346316 RepID=UPI0036E20C6D
MAVSPLLGLCLRASLVGTFLGLSMSALLDLRPAGFLYLMGAVVFWPRHQRRKGRP